MENRLDVLVRLAVTLPCFAAGLMEAGLLTGAEAWLSFALVAVCYFTVLLLAVSLKPWRIVKVARKLLQRKRREVGIKLLLNVFVEGELEAAKKSCSNPVWACLGAVHDVLWRGHGAMLKMDIVGMQRWELNQYDLVIKRKLVGKFPELKVRNTQLPWLSNRGGPTLTISIAVRPRLAEAHEPQQSPSPFAFALQRLTNPNPNVPNPFTSSGLMSAASEWAEWRAAAEDLYGHISLWDVDAKAAAQITELEFEECLAVSPALKIRLARKFPDVEAFGFVAGRLESGESRFTDETLRPAVARWLDDPIAALEEYADIARWDIGEVTDMSGLFADQAEFNEDISGWSVGSVTDMSGMFSGARRFAQDLGAWDTTLVADMSEMFQNAANFNAPIGRWNVAAVRDTRR